MSDRFFAWLVRLYPAGFRRAYDEEAVRLVLDRARDEKGILFRARLLVDLLWDLVVTISHRHVWQDNETSSYCPAGGTLSWRFVNDGPPRLATLAAGALVSLSLLAGFSASLGPAGKVTLVAWLRFPQPSQLGPERRTVQAVPVRNQTGGRQEPQLEYSIASLKRAKPGDQRRPRMEFLPGGGFRLTNMPLFVVLATAYQIPFQSRETLEQRINGIPDWMFSAPYDMELISAVPAPPSLSSEARNGRIRSTLQAVLADRLKLRMRREFAEATVYALIIGSGGVKLGPAKIGERDCSEAAPFGSFDLLIPGCHQFGGGPGRGLRGTAVNMADLAAYVSNWSDLPVIDQTGLTGLYQIQTEGWGSIEDSSGQTLEEVLDRLGLKLLRTKGKLEFFVVEHAELPLEN